jgi:hypothetical protein
MLIHNAEVTGSLNINNVPFNSGSFSGSFQGDGSQLSGVTGATTASYVEYSNVGNKPALVSGSSQITYSGLSGIPSGIVSGSSQVSFNGIVDKPTLVSGSSQVTYGELSGIPAGIVSGSSQVTYSGLSGIPEGIVSSSAQVEGYGIFATTGSNSFNGSQVITGSLTVTGEVVAQTLNVQQVTSSIIFSSGSNIFGNDLSNTQQFTGSLQVSGSSHYLLGNVGVGIDNPGSTLVIRGDNYVVANSGRSLGGIDILTTSSPGTGGYGGAISLGANGSGRAAIATVQGTSDNDNQGLAFFTHGSTGASDSVERMRITSGGDVSITSGNLSFANGSGIDFSATAGGGASSSLLDDYEEGTWTAVLRGQGTAGTYEIDTQYSTYTKIGRLVTLNCIIILDSVITGGGTSYLQVTGLPFSKGTNRQASGAVVFSGVDFSGSYVSVSFITANASNILYFPQTNDNSGVTDVLAADISASDVISFSISYEV